MQNWLFFKREREIDNIKIQQSPIGETGWTQSLNKMHKLYITARSKRNLPSENKYHLRTLNFNVLRGELKRVNVELISRKEESQFQHPVWYFHNFICCVYRKTCEKADYRKREKYFSSEPASASALPNQTVRICIRITSEAFVWSSFWAPRQKKQNKNRQTNWQTEKCFFKAAEEGFSTRPNTLAQMLVPMIPDQLLYSTCWSGVSYRFIFIHFIFLHTRTKWWFVH